jgi:hypothetical protein
MHRVFLETKEKKASHERCARHGTQFEIGEINTVIKPKGTTIGIRENKGDAAQGWQAKALRKPGNTGQVAGYWGLEGIDATRGSAGTHQFRGAKTAKKSSVAEVVLQSTSKARGYDLVAHWWSRSVVRAPF